MAVCEGVVMRGNIAVVTGANRGLGREVALALAKAGFAVVLACRNTVEAEKVRGEIRRESGNEDVNVMRLDISSRNSIVEFCDYFRKRFGRLNVLVNNAGVALNTREKTIDGMEMNIGTNYFGTFQLTTRMLPLFEKGADNRIVNLTSDIYKIGRFSFDKLDRYHWVKSYSISKYMILLFTLELAESGSKYGVKVNAVHPGIVKTSIMYTKKWYDIIIRLLLSPFFVDAKTGAEGVVYLACSGVARDINGKYFRGMAMTDVPRRYNNMRLRKELMEYSARISGE